MPSKYFLSSDMNSKTKDDNKQNSSAIHSEKKSLKKEDTIDMNEYNFEENLTVYGKNKLGANFNKV